MTQFQVHKSDLSRTRIVALDAASMAPDGGEILARVERFGFSANNVTYAVAGETLGYWQFFPPATDGVEDSADEWGVIPVWGFAEVVASNCEDIPVGDRLYGYFPPATHLLMKPENVSAAHFFDGTAHRSKLPKGYNSYQRVLAEPGYDRAGDNLRMLLMPLYLTSFCLWDQLKEHEWYGAEQIVLVSASSKTSIGLAQALADDPGAPEVVGLTSARNVEFVENLGLYDRVVDYDGLEQGVDAVPTAIVDMSGNATLLGRLHVHLGDTMKHMLDVGLTHWEGARKDANINRDRREFFFAPARIQQRMKDWGAAEFQKRAFGFVMGSAAKSAAWLKIETLDGLDQLPPVYDEVRDGKMSPQTGLVVIVK